jgi:hypothetical protein
VTSREGEAGGERGREGPSTTGASHMGADYGQEQQQQQSQQQKTSKNEASISKCEPHDTSKDMEAFQINLLSLASLMMLLNTLSRGLSAALPKGLDLTKNGMLPAWSTSLLR